MSRVSLVFTILVAGCSMQMMQHDPMIARLEADRFMKAFLVERDMTKSGSIVGPGLAKRDVVTDLEHLLRSLHPNSDFPDYTTSTDFEKMPGKQAMKIYAVGFHGDRVIYYCLTMNGTAPAGYRVAKIERRNEPFPETSLRSPLK